MADQLPYPDSPQQAGNLPHRESPPRMPGWVKVFGIAFLVLVLLVAVMIAGGHSPARHMHGAGLLGETPSSLILAGVQ